MINTKKTLLIFLIILIPSLSIACLIHLSRQEKEDVRGVTSTERVCTPYITNMMPNTASPNELYTFYPKIVGCKVEDVELKVSGAEWLRVEESKFISGTPTVFDIGIHRVLVSVESSGNISEYIEYIVVE